MSSGPARSLAIGLVRLAAILLPASQGAWSRAMIVEVAALDDDSEALRFALGCLWAAIVQAAIHHFPDSDDGGDIHHHCETETGPMEQFRQRDPRAIGLACAAGAVGLGAAYLAATQAPFVYIVVNATAFVLGLIAYAALGRCGWGWTSRGGAILLGLAVMLAATALFGVSADGGVKRWIWVGPLGVQVSLLFLPMMIVAFARHRDSVGAAGLVLAAIALALQPDRAMAAVLAASLLTLALLRFDLRTGVAMVAAGIAFAVTFVRPDTSPASPWVDQILYSAFDVHPLIGAAVSIGALLLIVPAILGFAKSAEHRHVYAVFGTVWIGIIAAAALGNYPTPLVGYGGSAVLGYLLSLASIGPVGSSRHAGELPGGERLPRADTVPGSLRAA